MRFDYLKPIKTARRNRVREVLADFCWLCILGASIFLLLWILAGSIK